MSLWHQIRQWFYWRVPPMQRNRKSVLRMLGLLWRGQRFKVFDPAGIERMFSQDVEIWRL